MDFFTYIFKVGQKAKVNKFNNTRFCRGCQKWYEQTEEYWYFTNRFGEPRPRGNYCRKCRAKLNNDDSQKLGIVPNEPCHYTCDLQKEHTTDFLTTIGWRYNKEGKLWWKPGVKLVDGTFVDPLNLIDDTVQTYPGGHPVDKIKDRQMPYRPSMTEEEKLEYIEYYKEGKTRGWIARESGRAKSTISLLIKNYENEQVRS